MAAGQSRHHAAQDGHRRGPQDTEEQAQPGQQALGPHHAGGTFAGGFKGRVLILEFSRLWTPTY
jgi:hypothetical protein